MSDEMATRVPTDGSAPELTVAHIAVAEDDPEMGALVAEGLRQDGHHVTELTDGATLLVRLARQYHLKEPAQKLDLVVCDIHMPIIGGLAVLKGLRGVRSRCRQVATH